MCGIAGVYLKDKKAGSKKKAEEFANALLLEIESRGRQATGFVSIGWDKSVKLDKADKTASEFIKEREEFQDDVQAFFLHTRLWTKGRPEEMGNNHPVSYNNCFAVHNGSIWNDDELFEEEGLKRHFQVDSEIIPALLNKYGVDHPEKIRTALEKLGGPLAIAAFDLRHPSRLILAKGANSPLHVFENQSVIVWASTHSAIKEAWGKVIGTPPKSDKIKYFKEGTFAIADDYKELGFYEFKPRERPKSEGWGRYGGGFIPRNQPRNKGWGPSRKPKDVPARPWDLDGPFHSRDEFLAAVRAYRLDADDRARLWSLRESYDDETDYSDVVGDKCWINCICEHSVLINDAKTHAKYGLICKDCYTTITEKYKDNATIVTDKDLREPDRDEDDPFEDIHIPEIPPRERSNLESWAEIEARFHRNTLAELSDYTGYTPNAIDFLVFRTQAGASADFGLHITHLKFKLKQAYDAVNEFLHTEYGREILAEVNAGKNITQEAAQEIAEQQAYPWSAYDLINSGGRTVMYVCDAHNERFPYGLSCGECLSNDTELEAEIQGDHDDWGSACGVQVFEESDETATNLPLERCGKCGMWNQGGCPDCPDPKRPELPAPEVTRCCCKSGNTNRKCRRKLTLVMHDETIGKPMGYCARHWDKCSSDKCNGDAIFTGLDGARWCHPHSRKKQGVADAYITKNGYNRTIQEVK